MIINHGQLVTEDRTYHGVEIGLVRRVAARGEQRTCASGGHNLLIRGAVGGNSRLSVAALGRHRIHRALSGGY
jgi:hypothetical protein